jgi:hypothetical protein
MMILKELDKTFQYDDQVQVEMPRAFEKFFYDGLSRRDGQTLINYVADHREYLMEVERHGVNIPEKVAGWLLLRRAGLTMEQKQLVQGRAKELDHLVPPKPSSARTIRGSLTKDATGEERSLLEMGKTTPRLHHGRDLRGC